ncbi:MAG TPA: cadherin-like domain-containing protein [Longimicrobium sp.]|nr:cadherin-like domain-containing protein [Longimicrobium sp.]
MTFTATGVAGAAVNMVKSAGDGQSATAGLAVAVAPAVTVTDANANPVAGVSVTFAVASGGGSVTGSPAVTNASGVATVGSWTLGNTAGANTLDASATGLTTVTFTATGTPGAVDHFVVEAAAGGNIADQLSGTPFNVKVTARDIHNNTATAFTGTVGFTSSPGGGISAGAGPSLAFTAGVLSSHSITMSTPGAYTGLTATRTGGSEAGTSNSFEVQAPPTAVADGPTGSSAPGDPYHTAFNTTFNLATLGTLANDTRGFPLATVASFGGGDLGGTVTGHAGGSTVSPLPGHPDGSLTVNANGSLAFTPPAGFTGLYTFQYRISNVRGTSDAQVTVAVGVRPAAGADSYPTNLLGNVPINTATSSNFNVTSNDAGDAKVLALGTSTNGTTILNANGTFTFTPSAGYTGAASFTYTVTNGFATTAPATVSMTVSGIAWFVDKGAAAGDGRFGTPFNDLSTAFAAATKPLANQPIFLYASGTSYTGGVTLLGGQRLVGAGATGASFASVMGVTWPADAGAQPGIGGTSPTVVSGLTLGNGNTLQGFNLGGSGTLTGTSFGTLTVSEVGINTTGQALNLTTGTLSGSFTGVTSSGGTNNVALSGVTLSGGVGLGGGALSGASGSGLVITNGTSAGASDVLSYSGTLSNATAGAANATVAVSGGSTRLSLTGNVSQTGSGAAVSASGGHTGTLTFNTGTVSATNGTGLQFDNADGSYDFGSSPNLSLNGGDAGIDVQNGSGGTFTFASSAVITNPTAEAVRINASSPTFTYPGRITKTNGSTGITVSSNSSGTISFGSRSKAITSTGGNVAVNLATNGTATITFLDSLVIGSASGAGFNVTGGGTVSVQGANNTVNSTAGGTAVNVSSTTIAASGLTFKSVNATGSGTNGIVLSSTGSGPFTVTGDGNSDPNNTTRGRTTAKEGGGTVTLGSGGTISGRSGNGITLATTGAVTLHNMVITGSASSGDGINASSTGRLTIDNTRITAHASDHGLWGSTVSGLAIHHSEIDNNATTAGVVEGPDIWNVRLLELTGTDSIRNSNIHHSQEDVLGILNTSGTLNLTVLNTNITDTGTGAGGTTAFAVSASGTSNVTVNLQNDSINRGRARGVDFGTGTSSSAVFNTTINNSQFMQNGAAISIVQGSSGTNTFNITSNNLQSNDAGSLQAMIINRAGSPSFNSFGLFTGTISGNTIGTTAVANSGSGTSNGIDIKSNGSGGATRVAVVNNTIRQVGLNGISVAVVDGNTGGTTPPTMEARIQGNDISVLNAAIGADGINIQSGALNTDDVTMCVDIISNTSVGIRNGLRVRGSGAPTAPATVQLEGWDGSTARATYFANRPNTLSGGSGAYNENIPSAPGGYVAVASCNTP